MANRNNGNGGNVKVAAPAVVKNEDSVPEDPYQQKITLYTIAGVSPKFDLSKYSPSKVQISKPACAKNENIDSNSSQSILFSLTLQQMKNLLNLPIITWKLILEILLMQQLQMDIMDSSRFQ